MSGTKRYRGRNIKKIPNWRGSCPSCARRRVKILWSVLQGGDTVKVCKLCNSRSLKLLGVKR